jgi:integrase
LQVEGKALGRSGEEFSIPVHPELQKIFDEGRGQRQKNVIDIKSGKKKRRPKTEADPLLFTWQGEKIGSIKTAFKSACDRAGIAYGREVPGGITFKDLRHTFASHFLMNGGSLEELQELMAHSDITTTKRYAHITQEHKRKVLLQMTGLVKSDSEPHVSSCQLEAQSE